MNTWKAGDRAICINPNNSWRHIAGRSPNAVHGPAMREVCVVLDVKYYPSVDRVGLSLAGYEARFDSRSFRRPDYPDGKEQKTQWIKTPEIA